jgi:hypothetical protein
MDLELPEDVLSSLPEPDPKGVVRVTMGLRMNPEGGARVVEINDTPVAGDDSSEEEEPEETGGDDYSDDTSPASQMPDTRDVANSLYA